MASDKSREPRRPGETNPPRGQWLTTDDWLQVTPTREKPANETPPPAVSALEATDDDINIADEVAVAASSDGDIGLYEVPVSQLLDSKLKECIPAADLDDILTPTPPIGPASGWLDADARKAPATIPPGSDADIDIDRPPPPPRHQLEEPSDIFSHARRGGGSSDVFGGNSDPAGSALHAGYSSPSDGGSNVFGDPSKVGGGGESDLFGGYPVPSADRGSSVFDDSSRRTEPVAYTPPKPPARAADATDRVAFEIDRSTQDPANTTGNLDLIEEESDSSGNLFPGHADSGGSGPNFNSTERDSSGSNLFGDQTVLDMDLSAVQGASGVNLLDPDGDRNAGLTDGPRSSIFGRPDQPSDGGHVDFEQIPLMGGATDDRTDSMLFPEDAEVGPRSGIFGRDSEHGPGAEGGIVSFDLPPMDAATTQASKIPHQDSGGIDWTAPMSHVTRPAGSDKDIKYDPTAPDVDIDRLAAELSGRHARNLDDESVFSAPDIDPADFGLPPISAEGGSDVMTTPLPKASAPMLNLPGAASRKMPPAAPLSLAKASKPSLREEFAAKPAKPAGRGKLLVGALGVLAGTGIGVGAAMFAGVGKDPSPAPANLASVNPAPRGTTDAPAPTVAMIAADPAAALAAFAAAGDAPEAKAGRGQARWLARVRAAAASGESLADDDAELKTAAADLQAVLDGAAELKTPAEQQAGLQAGLHLGLIREAVGQPDAAIAAYTKAKAALPLYAKVFDAAVRRVTVMKKAADGTNRTRYSSLPPAAAADLADAVRILDFPPVQQIDDEPGFHFWDAVNHSAAWSTPGAFPNAIAAIDKAKAAHEVRRKKFAGMGLNPLSDPSEQMFARACEELKFYWSFKGKLYDDPVGLELAKKSGGTNGMLDELLRATKAGGADPAELTAAKAAAAKAASDLAATKTQAEADLTAAKKQAETDATALRDQATAALKAAADKTKIATDATATAAAAAVKLKAADAALDAVVTKLKEAKLIDPAADWSAAVAAIPDAAKKATLVAGGGDATDLAKQLTAARAEAKKASDDAAAAVKVATAAEAAARGEAQKLQQAMAAAGKDFDAKTAAAVQAATEKAAADVKQLAAARAEDARAFEQKMATQAEQFRQAIVAARSGQAVALTEVERSAADKAAKDYAAGLDAYFAGQYATAEPALARAVAADPADARYWYFLGLTKWSQGRSPDAEGDFRKGAELESRGKPGRRGVGLDLLRVQGAARVAVDSYRP